MTFRTVVNAVFTAMLFFCLAGAPASAKDIRLGGQKDNKTPNNIVTLPTIAVAIRTDDGGWKHIKIDAWLAATDADNAKRLESLKSVIINKTDRELPNRSFETLQSADLGSVEAKKVIRAIVEAELGQAWKGDVLIRNMLVY